MTHEEEPLYLGFDLSTQQLKGVILNKKLEVVYKSSVQYDNELPEFRTHNGVIHGRDKSVTTPVLLWVKALDMLLDKLSVCGADFSKVIAVSGSAQQHGTVYWTQGAEEILKNLDSSNFMHTQLASCFSVSSSPVWMDSSTRDQCERIEVQVGGELELARITGSKAYERFSAAQIAKICETKSTAYKSTERISLISNFLCSLFLGCYAPIDWSDASGTNLFDIREKKWSQKCLDACAPDLENKLGEPSPSDVFVGNISKYLVDRFSFPEECKVLPFTGDNPSSLAGMGVKKGDVAISLGTSDTLFLRLVEPKILPYGHILVNPIQTDQYMALLCFKNGSLTRERVKRTFAKGSWDEFNKLLGQTLPGNQDYLGLYFDCEEIIPKVEGDYKFNSRGQPLAQFPCEATEVRALIEGQFLAKRAHSQDLGFTVGSDSRLFATGGASINQGLLQILSDVFKTPVYVLESENSALMGAAYRASYAIMKQNGSGDLSFDEVVNSLAPPKLALEPSPQAQIYDVMVERYKEVMNTLTAGRK